ncbi:MAG: class I SAM-dependent methyltransferase [Mesonia hippocampi]|uniref:class I SAM-dependent methyltransferase n=1 Tax=Mesonia hippocampi TaxID=1628250 RepID=UPI003F9562F2
MDVNKTTFLRCKDYTVSGETFDLCYNQERDILQTKPVPNLTALPYYYKSEAYISHTDSAASIKDKIYQRVKKYMLAKKISWLNNYIKGETKTLLDIGAGTGDFLKEAKNKNWKIKGIEPNADARKLALKKGITLCETHAEINTKFSAITMWHVLEHVPNLENEISFIKNHLQENGFVFIAVPNFKSYDAAYYKEHWAAYDVPRHLWHFSKEGIERIFSQQGFKLCNIHPLIFDAYYVSLLSEKYKHKSTNFLKAMQLGYKSNRKAKKTGEYSSLVYVFCLK